MSVSVVLMEEKNMPKVLFTNESKCLGCRSCELACSFYHYQEKNPARALLKIVKIEDKFKDVPVICRHCKKAPCLEACPVGAIERDKITDAVKINQEKCIGCRVCVDACPFSIIVVDPKTNNVAKCDLCDGDPRCAKVCPVKAVFFARADIGPKILMRSKMDKTKKP